MSAGRRHLLETDPAIELLGTWGFALQLGSREDWVTADLGDALRAPILSRIPVIFLNGDWDVNTPIENMLQIAPYFPAARAIIVHRGEHTGPARLTRQSPATFAALLAFLRTGATVGLPAELTLSPPAFAAPSFPPPRR